MDDIEGVEPEGREMAELEVLFEAHFEYESRAKSRIRDHL